MRTAEPAKPASRLFEGIISNALASQVGRTLRALIIREQSLLYVGSFVAAVILKRLDGPDWLVLSALLIGLAMHSMQLRQQIKLAELRIDEKRLDLQRELAIQEKQTLKKGKKK